MLLQSLALFQPPPPQQTFYLSGDKVKGPTVKGLACHVNQSICIQLKTAPSMVPQGRHPAVMPAAFAPWHRTVALPAVRTNYSGIPVPRDCHITIERTPAGRFLVLACGCPSFAKMHPVLFCYAWCSLVLHGTVEFATSIRIRWTLQLRSPPVLVGKHI